MESNLNFSDFESFLGNNRLSYYLIVELLYNPPIDLLWLFPDKSYYSLSNLIVLYEFWSVPKVLL